jgi:bifunctional non-homologous end joining protein LigD
MTRNSAKVTHPDRVYWPDAGITKEGLAQYYADVWRRMAPFIVKRPLALVRCPQGVTGQCFFQKHAWQGLSRNIRRLPDPKDSNDELLVVNDVAGLSGLVQAGALEIHPWGASLAALEQPDIIIMDLDPGESVGWPEVIAAAIEVRDRFAAQGMTSFTKTSGGKGLHVVVPLKPKAEWTTVKDFTKAMAEAMAADSPGKFVATVAKSKRRGRILVDYLRNSRGATAVAPYSTRARPGASVSMPLGWDELSPGIGPAYFTVANSPTCLSTMEVDPWADFRQVAVPLPAAQPPRKRAG